MTPILTYTLIIHVITGVLAIGLVHLVFMHFLRKAPSWKYLSLLTLGGIVLFLVSWITSAYYYVTYYGKAVKPVIVEGAYPWAHKVFMEGKEHLFIILPFLAITLLLLIQVLRHGENKKLKTAGTILALTALLLGAFVAGAGIIVSGAYR